MSPILEDSRDDTQKKFRHSKLVAFDKVSHRLSLSCPSLNHNAKGEGRFGFFVLCLLKQEEEDRLRQDVPSLL